MPEHENAGGSGEVERTVEVDGFVEIDALLSWFMIPRILDPLNP